MRTGRGGKVDGCPLVLEPKDRWRVLEQFLAFRGVLRFLIVEVEPVLDVEVGVIGVGHGKAEDEEQSQREAAQKCEGGEQRKFSGSNGSGH